MSSETQSWLETNDPEVTALALEALIEQRIITRQEEEGFTAVYFPDFSSVSEMPVPADCRSSPDLFFHLRALNQLEPPQSLPVLAASPATRLPLIGKVWQLIRHHAHELVCFYVNRLADHTATTHHEMVGALNELTRLSQAQQAEIEQLRADIQTLKEGKD